MTFIFTDNDYKLCVTHCLSIISICSTICLSHDSPLIKYSSTKIELTSKTNFLNLTILRENPPNSLLNTSRANALLRLAPFKSIRSILKFQNFLLSSATTANVKVCRPSPRGIDDNERVCSKKLPDGVRNSVICRHGGMFLNP